MAVEPETRNPEPETVVAVHPWPTCPEYADKGPSLAEKAAFLDDLVVAQHLPDGLLRTITIADDGSVKLHSLPSTGLWTAIYLASQALRYAVTGEEEAQVNAGKAVEGLHHLTAVTGSSGYAVALEHLDDEAILSVIRADVLAFADHLVSNDLQIIDWDGKVSEHGRMFYSAMDDFPGFNAMLVLSWLRLETDSDLNKRLHKLLEVGIWRPPDAYLLAYWMGRYHGFIASEM